MTTMTETGWDPLNDDLGYGRHTMKSTSYRIAPEDELTVEDILNRRSGADILTATISIGEAVPESSESILKRLADERLITPAEKTKILDSVLLKPYRPGHKPDPDATVGFLPITPPVVRPRRTAYRIVGAEDAAVAALRHRPGWPRESIPMPGEPGFTYDEPPIGHETGAHPLDMTRVGDFTPVDTRVKRPALWRQALIGLGLMREKK